jgi:hypothetical protein
VPRPDIVYDNLYMGSGYEPLFDAYYDDFCLHNGKVEFPDIAPQAPIAPIVNSPIVDGDETVTISRVDAYLPPGNTVRVYDQGDNVIGTYATTPADTNGIVEVTLTRPLVHQDEIRATQENTVGESVDSEMLEVGAGNGDVLLGLGVTDSDGIEWLEVTTIGLGGSPQGIAVSPMNGWQTIIFDPANTVAITGFTGNGQIDAATGLLEHLAVTVNAASPDRSSGVYRLYVDNVSNVGGVGLITDFEGFLLGSEVLFQEPTYSGSTDFNLSFPPSDSANTDVYNNGGDRSQLLTWFFKDTGEDRWVRLTTSQANNVPSPTIDLTQPIQMDILLWVECPTVKGDLDGDCGIGLTDYALFEACLIGPDASAGPACTCADFNNDGRVTLEDFGRFQEDFTNGFPVPGCTP